jgi:hypothetical protein
MKAIPVACLPYLIPFGPIQSDWNKKKKIGWRQQGKRNNDNTSIGPGYLKAHRNRFIIIYNNENWNNSNTMTHDHLIKWKTKNTTLSEQFLNQISKSQKDAKSITLIHKYMTSNPHIHDL